MKVCPHCEAQFEPRRPDQVYCRAAHRIAHYAATVGDGGLRAPVRSVKRLANGGVSITLRFTPNDAPNAFQLVPGAIVEVVKR